MKHDSDNLAERYFVLAIKIRKKVLLIATVYEANARRTLPERQGIVTATKMKRSNTCRLNSTVQSDTALSKSQRLVFGS
jgi:hypothetical protein